MKAQQTGPHSQQQALFGNSDFKTEDAYDKSQGIRHDSPGTLSKNCLMRRQVYGWHPAWSGTAYQRYDFGLLSTVAYYSYEIDPTTGSYKTIHQWRETGLVEMAHLAGTQVELTASVSGSDTRQLLGNTKACETLIDSLLALVKMKDADGVCIDFEGVKAGNAVAFANLVDSLAAELHRWRGSATVTVTLPAMDREKGYDVALLGRVANRLIVKAYDSRDVVSPKAGPLAPLHSSSRWGEASLETSLKNYLAAGAPKAKLLAGVPYFGYEWPTQSAEPGSKAAGKGEVVLLRDYERMDSTAFLQWDSASTTGWLLNTSNGKHHQLWIDQVSSLTEKYALVKQMDIAGVAIWALGYDHGSDRYWNLLKGQFADCSATDSDELAQDSKPVTPGLEGETSAERNVWNWVWMLGGGIAAIAIIWAVKKYM